MEGLPDRIPESHRAQAVGRQKVPGYFRLRPAREPCIVAGNSATRDLVPLCLYTGMVTPSISEETPKPSYWVGFPGLYTRFLAWLMRRMPSERQRLLAVTILAGGLCGLAAVAFHLSIAWLEAVSYTHLDVYKRQPPKQAFRMSGRVRVAGMESG